MGTYKNDVLVPMTGDDIKSLFTTPEDLKNHCVELVGKVFSAPDAHVLWICKVGIIPSKLLPDA